MQIAHCTKQLERDLFDAIGADVKSPFIDILKQISEAAELHDNEYSFLIFEEVIQVYDVGVFAGHQSVNFSPSL
jgi:hypothetical protein